MAQKMLFNTDVEFTTVTTSSNLKESAFEPSAGDISSYGSIWTGMYDGVNRTNDVIEGIEQSPLFEAADKTKPSRLMHYYGEAKVLRARLPTHPLPLTIGTYMPLTAVAISDSLVNI